jgi:WD40 repeat protein
MLFNNEKRCLVFVRQDDANDKRAEVGNLVVYVCAETLTKDNFKEKYFDLQMRYEWVADELHNVFQVYFSQDSKGGNQSMKLFACGYMDNSLRIFDLDNKAGPTKIIHDHNARITCLKFSSNFKFLYTCDEDGVILHYGRKKLLPKDQKD